MREAVAADSGVAVESARARTRRRMANSVDEEMPIGKRDPGYSQEVRFACQQRLVQLIPVKKSTMASLASVLVSAWASLLLLHYLVNIRSSNVSGTYVALLFDVRSPNSLCHWLGLQLWVFTGIASLLVYQLRRHKLDDYRAKYRIWLFLAGASFFSSFDASTSALQIIGYTIDPWTQRQFSLPGWPVVLSGFASIVGVLGLRLCTELKSSPGSVSLWLSGLVSWAFSAVLGTGLFKIDWTTNTINLVVGATWLGGIILVFLASATYLRYTYIQAQKRFALRNKWLAEKQKWQMPKISLRQMDPRRMAQGLKSKLRRKERDVAVSVSIPSLPKPNADEIEPVKSSVTNATAAASSATQSNFRGEAVRSPSSSTTEAVKNSNARNEGNRTTGNESEMSAEPKKSKSWMPWKRNRNIDSNAEVEYSDVGAEVRVRDRGLISAYEKVGASQTKSEQSPAQRTAEKSASAADAVPAKAKTGTGLGSFWKSRSAKSTEGTSESIKQTVSSKANAVTDASELPNESKRSWSMGIFKRSKKKVAKPASNAASATKPATSKESEGTLVKRSLFSRMSKPKTASVEKPKPEAAKDAKPKTKKKFSLFGFLDGMALKPPASGESAANSKSVGATSTSATSSVRAVPTSTAGSNQSSNQNYDDDDDDSQDYRNMSKAERKKQRRQNRAA
jgi:hypothetical protein